MTRRPAIRGFPRHVAALFASPATCRWRGSVVLSDRSEARGNLRSSLAPPTSLTVHPRRPSCRSRMVTGASRRPIGFQIVATVKPAMATLNRERLLALTNLPS
jgi:hypothetical protein